MLLRNIIKSPWAFALILPISVALLSNSNGRATQANEGNTGAPGDNAPNNRTCQTCHGSNIQLTNQISVKNANGEDVNEFTPGETYTVTVSLSSTGNPSTYGFQLVSEYDNGDAVNSFASPSANAKIVALANGRQYVEQNGASTSNEFTVEWTAPANPEGKVTFYSGAVATNGNSMSSGDGAALSSLSVDAPSVSNKDVNLLEGIRLYPNPSTDFIILDGMTEATNYSIFDMNGKVLQAGLLSTGSVEVNIQKLSAGNYFLHMNTENKSFSTKFTKN